MNDPVITAYNHNLLNGKPLSITWQSPSNIAIVKYWGKTGRQLPLNPSVSLSLSRAYTETRLTAFPGNFSGAISLDFLFNGKPNTAFGERISKLLTSVADEFPFLNQLYLKIESGNTFPHSSGIASSASSFSALALCICSLAEHLRGFPDPDFRRNASQLARLGSGSACRSLYSGFSLWGETAELPDSSSDLYAIPVPLLHPVFGGLRDAILLLNQGTKKVSSSLGHSRMEHHPFGEARIRQANINTADLLKALAAGDTGEFIRIAENEALTLHALMMTSQPGFVLLEPETLRIINRIREIREQTGLQISFTLDAGPNIHLMYFESDREQVQRIIVEDLLQNDKQNKWIDDQAGTGPLQIT